jgi:ABC-type multidrug transport system fused ATPase/permease subunit
MEISSKQILKALNILSWIIFIGICVRTGGYIFNTIFLLTSNPFGSHYFWEGADLSGLLVFDRGYFMVIAFLMILVSVMKSLMFYWIIKILHDNKLNMDKPFNNEICSFIFKLSYASLAIGLFSGWAAGYSVWLDEKGAFMPSLQSMHVDGAGAWWFIAVILFVIGHIFKRGIEIQTENELTV